jgi:hypothetical protein
MFLAHISFYVQRSLHALCVLIWLYSPLQMGRVDGISSQQNKDDNKLNWTDVLDRSIKSSTSIGTFLIFGTSILFQFWSHLFVF